MKPKTWGVLEMAAAMAISGTVGWFVLETRLPPAAVVFWRCALGAAAMLLACAGLRLFRPGVLSARQAALAALGGAALVANWVLLFAAYAHASIAVATVTYHTQPFMLVALGALVFGERLAAVRVGWLAVAFVGVALIALGGQGGAGGEEGASGPGRYLLGVGLALAAAGFYAVAAAIAKGLQGVPAPVIVAVQMAVQMAVGTVLLLPCATWPEGTAAPRTWGLLLAIGFVHTGLMSTLLYGAIQKLPTALVGALSFVYPIVAVAVDAWAFGHWLGPLQVGGACAILAAVAGMQFGWGGGRRPRRPA